MLIACNFNKIKKYLVLCLLFVYNIGMEMVEVKDIKQYLRDEILKGRLYPFFAIKVAKVKARRGVVGEIINSFSREGNHSTTKAVFRTANGEIDWVVTNDNGDQYVIDDETFKNNYKPLPNSEDYRTVKREKLIVKVHEGIQFKNKHGNSFRVQPNYYIAIDENDDFYEISPEEFRHDYRISDREFDILKDPHFKE